MSVAMMLGVDDVEAPAMMAARNSWEFWTATDPLLGVVEDLLDLPEWTLDADPEPKDAVLRSLAKLGAADGGDDHSATTALTWLLVPGAAALAYRLSDLAHNRRRAGGQPSVDVSQDVRMGSSPVHGSIDPA